MCTGHSIRKNCRRHMQTNTYHHISAAKRKKEKILLKKIFFCFSAAFLTILFSMSLPAIFAEANETSYRIAAVSAAGYEEKSEKYYKSIELVYGDTLWEIAERYVDDSYDSIYDYIDELKEINGLMSEHIHAGRYLTVVYSASHDQTDIRIDIPDGTDKGINKYTGTETDKYNAEKKDIELSIHTAGTD